MIIKFNDILEGAGLNAVSSIKTGSELLLAYELDVVLHKLSGDSVTLEGCDIDRGLLGQVYFNRCIVKGLMIDDKYRGYEGKEYGRSFFDKDITEIEFIEKNDDMWIYSHDASDFKNRVIMLEGVRFGRGYIALVAYLIAYRYLNKTTTRLKIEQRSISEYEYNELLVLMYYGNKIVDEEVIDLKFDEINMLWEAYRLMNNQVGMMCKKYTPNEKFRLCKRMFKVGDIVLRYEKGRDRKTTGNTQLASCYPAVIREISTKGIKFTYYPMTETKLTRKRNIEKLNSEIYSINDEKTFPECTVILDWQSIGICGMTYDERTFITEVFRDDGTYQILSDGETEEEVFLDTAETIYAVFKDRGVDCNIEKFKKEFFGNNIPKYDEYKVRIERR